MKFSFKKIGSVLTSAAMLTSTVALAAAANFPAPFVSGGKADVAIVYGSGANLDVSAATDIQSYLTAEFAKQTVKPGQKASADDLTNCNADNDCVPLFTSGTKIYLNDSLNKVRTVLTDKDLPTLLADGSFSGNVDATISHLIHLGSQSSVKFAKEPTSSDDPDFGLYTSVDKDKYLLNLTAIFSTPVNFTHSDSKGEDLEMFGQIFTVATSTTSNSLVLLKSAERIFLTSSNPSIEVTVGGKGYTVKLIGSKDTSASIGVTDSSGNSKSGKIDIGGSKKIGDVTIALIDSGAGSANQPGYANIVVGADKITLTDGESISYGEQDTPIEGTSVSFNGGTTDALNKITISFYAATTDEDFLKAGEAFSDPVFGAFKVGFAGLNIPLDNVGREDIKIANSGDDKMTVSFTDYEGNEAKGLIFAVNQSNGLHLAKDSEGRNITVREMAPVYRDRYVIVGNENDAKILRVSSITNTTGYTNDKVDFVDVMSGETISQKASEEGKIDFSNIGNNPYTVYYYGTSTDTDSRYIRINYPDSSDETGAMVVYPSIETSKGAKLIFYEPQTVLLTNWDGRGNDLKTIKIPDGDGYTDITISDIGGNGGSGFNVTCGGTMDYVNVSKTSELCSIGELTYNVTYGGANTTTLKLVSPNGGNIDLPALVIIEDKDHNSKYNALVVTLEEGGTSEDGIGVSEVIRTWSNDAEWGGSSGLSLASDSKISKKADLWGSVITLDNTDSDQKTATINYPTEQIYAKLYLSKGEMVVTPGEGGGVGAGELGNVIITDKEVSSVGNKNLIVVGGSCVNTIAAQLLGVKFPTCTESFTTATGVGAGQYLIQTFSYSTGKIATLVAGYHAEDTKNAATALTTSGKIDTTVNKKYVGSTAKDVTAA